MKSRWLTQSEEEMGQGLLFDNECEAGVDPKYFLRRGIQEGKPWGRRELFLVTDNFLQFVGLSRKLRL